MAARGVRLYAKKGQVLMDPIFYAKKREETVGFMRLREELQDGLTFAEIKRNHPDADEEDLRQRGIKAIESNEGSTVLSTLDRNGVDSSVRLAKMDARRKEQMLACLNDRQKASFLPQIKVDLLKRRMTE
jgi:hypothetical protein